MQCRTIPCWLNSRLLVMSDDLRSSAALTKYLLLLGMSAWEQLQRFIDIECNSAANNVIIISFANKDQNLSYCNVMRLLWHTCYCMKTGRSIGEDTCGSCLFANAGPRYEGDEIPHPAEEPGSITIALRTTRALGYVRDWEWIWLTNVSPYVLHLDCRCSNQTRLGCKSQGWDTSASGSHPSLTTILHFSRYHI